MSKPRFLVIAGLASSLVNFRGHLLAALAERGVEVHAAAPDFDHDRETAERLQAMGVTCHQVAFERTGTNPLGDLAGLVSLIRLMRRLRPESTLGYTIKPVIYGTLAAWIAGVPRRFALITGLGYAFTGDATGRRARVQRLARFLYRRALRRATKVFFQNPDDASLFRELGLLSRETPVVIVNGSGVDLDDFAVAPIPDGTTRFLLIARLLGDKGIREYAAAAEALRAKHPQIECHIVGGTDTNPDAIALSEIEHWQQGGTLIWHGELADVRPVITNAHVYVLPSYREGTPRTVLEAMAMGRPIITTDAPGCRETVRQGENGFMVPVGDAEALASAMTCFVEDPDLIERMGHRSREIAAEKYDVHKVNAVMLDEMGI
ncbi:glycosyltransferase family 4 protein [Rhodobacteraceae bacterium NNCM2]|nr:glycosyltransferase family 4 protein [Coraliihabitans acroporae]